MGKQIQIKATIVKRDPIPVGSPTISKKLTKIWFGGQS